MSEETFRLNFEHNRKKPSEKTIRKRVWYQRYFEIGKALKENKCRNIEEVLYSIHAMMDSSHSYHYRHLAWSAHESIALVVKDLKKE